MNKEDLVRVGIIAASKLGIRSDATVRFLAADRYDLQVYNREYQVYMIPSEADVIRLQKWQEGSLAFRVGYSRALNVLLVQEVGDSV